MRIQSLARTFKKVDMWLDLSRCLLFHLSNEDNNIEHQTVLLKWTSFLGYSSLDKHYPTQQPHDNDAIGTHGLDSLTKTLMSSLGSPPSTVLGGPRD